MEALQTINEEKMAPIQKDEEVTFRISQLIQLRESQQELMQSIKQLNPYLNKEGKELLAKLIVKKEASIHYFSKLEEELYVMSFSVFEQISHLLESCSKTERLMCMYLMLDYSVHEIALMTGKNKNAVSVAITRLKNKLNVDEFKYLKQLIRNEPKGTFLPE